ncbi:hypothetical protein L2E82_31687 [Cichorium intybus]|uniref:Uncharacterized protein n=1 Tax=Cichorium intybus TaxID=13427 RepID=A0ACB9BEM4_CICIN|nr:hypothetical protein L2E82_31687 [Cichorium intybus]
MNLMDFPFSSLIGVTIHVSKRRNHKSKSRNHIHVSKRRNLDSNCKYESVVDLADARDLLPKDGLGSSSAYVVADFDGQKKRTSTVSRSLNPLWNESLEFVVSDPSTMEYEELEIEVFNDKRLSNGSARKNHFLGRVKLYGSRFARKGDEGINCNQ